MPGRPCTPAAGAETDPASVPVDGHGHSSAVGWINLTTLLLRRFASFGSRCSSGFGDPKGSILRFIRNWFQSSHRGEAEGGMVPREHATEKGGSADAPLSYPSFSLRRPACLRLDGGPP